MYDRKRIGSRMEPHGTQALTGYSCKEHGMAKWSVEIFRRAVKKILEGKNVIALNIISRYLLHYRATILSTTRKSPAEMLFNQKLHTWLNLLKKSVNKQDWNYEHRVVCIRNIANILS